MPLQIQTSNFLPNNFKLLPVFPLPYMKNYSSQWHPEWKKYTHNHFFYLLDKTQKNNTRVKSNQNYE